MQLNDYLILRNISVDTCGASDDRTAGNVGGGKSNPGDHLVPLVL
jgi:hypothetical protein